MTQEEANRTSHRRKRRRKKQPRGFIERHFGKVGSTKFEKSLLIAGFLLLSLSLGYYILNATLQSHYNALVSSTSY